MILEPIGFWSYTRDDDELSNGRLSQLRALLARELQLRFGRPEGVRKVRIFQDVSTIPYGASWAPQIEHALRACGFFIPIVTPGFLQSEWCCKELLAFRAREAALGRDDLIFPLHYIDVGPLDGRPPSATFNPEAWNCLIARQWIEYRPLRRFQPENNSDVAERLERMAEAIVGALQRDVPLPSPPLSDLRDDGLASVLRVVRLSQTHPEVFEPSQAPQTAHFMPPAAGFAAYSQPDERQAEAPLPTPPPVVARPRRSLIWVGAVAFAAALFVTGLLYTADYAPRTASVSATAMAPAAPSAGPAPARPPQQTRLPAPPPQPAYGSVIRDCPTCPEMVLIPPGNFTMGVSPAEDSEAGIDQAYDDDARPLHRVVIAHPFYIGKYDVTRGEFAAFVARTGPRPAGGCWAFPRDKDGGGSWELRKDRDWQNPGFPQSDRDPVVCVSAQDAAAYAAWLSSETGHTYRLPSEAEWEYAARGGTTAARYWDSGAGEICAHANVSDEAIRQSLGASPGAAFAACNDGYAFTSPVGRFPPNSFGLYDMLGNVAQLTADPWHDSYNGAPADGGIWTTGGKSDERAVRGGSWNTPAIYVQSGHRFFTGERQAANTEGFRVVRMVAPP